MAKRCAFYGVILSLALICGYVETLIPINLGLPGIKLGLANIVAVWLLYKKGFLSALAVNTARILLVGILFGNAVSVVYALCGGTFAVITMSLIKRIKIFSAVGVSIAGAFFHNVGQLLAAAFVIGSKAVIYYLPFLTLSAVVTGLIIGFVAVYLLKRVRYTT